MYECLPCSGFIHDVPLEMPENKSLLSQEPLAPVLCPFSFLWSFAAEQEGLREKAEVQVVVKGQWRKKKKR